jgi:hypothetical protein
MVGEEFSGTVNPVGVKETVERALELTVVISLHGFDDAEPEGDAGRVELVDPGLHVARGDTDLDDLPSFLGIELGTENIDGPDTGFQLLEVLGIDGFVREDTIVERISTKE